MKYQLLYVNETLIETGGSWWPKVFNLIMIFVFIALFLNISVLVTTLWTSKTANSQGPAIFAAITLFLLLLFWFYYSVIFEPKCRILFEQDQDVLRRPSIASNESINFETQVFNPVLEKTLKKVWLPNALKDTLNSYHTVEFESLQDYINVMRPLNSPDSLIDLRSSMVRKREREAAKSALRRMDSLKIPVEIGGELEGLNISALNTPSDSMGDLNNSDVDLLRYVSVDEIEMGGLK